MGSQPSPSPSPSLSPVPLRFAPLRPLRVAAKLVLPVVALVLVLAVACGPDGGPEPVEPSPESPPAARYEMRSLERSAGDCATEGAPCARVSLRWPEVTATTSPSVTEAVNRRIEEMLLAPSFHEDGFESPENLAERFLARFEEQREAVPDDPTLDAWEDTRHLEVLFLSPRVLSLRFEETLYTGGAHPQTTARLESLDLGTGEPLELDDLLLPGWEEPLDAAGEEAFRAARDLEPEEDLVAAGFSFPDGFRLNDNFAVTDVGLLFHFNPYEVSSYAAGPTEFTVPWAEIADRVDPEGPAARLVDRAPSAEGELKAG